MDKYKIDSHKLIYHIERLGDWLNDKLIYPIYMEVSPAGACNHRCTYCGLDFMNYQARYLKTAIFKQRLTELGKLGLKSIMYAGEGEPFLHKNMAEIINHTKASGIDVAVTTNATMFNRELIDGTLGAMEWVKVSINGATKQTYSKIHRCREEDFDKVLANMSYAAELKRKKRFNCALGMQLLLLPQNSGEVASLAQLARDMGMNYLVVKPYSQHPQSKTDTYKNIKYSEYEWLKDELDKFNTPTFSTIFRMHTMQRWDTAERDYKRCFALPFWSYIDAGGGVWGCSVYLEDQRFFYGNIYGSSFEEIWEGERRLKSLNWAEANLDTSRCRLNCRMDKINGYLWNLKNLPLHVNFI